MAGIARLKGTMFLTIIITLVIFVIFIGAVTLLFSASTDLNLSPYSTLFGAFVLALFFMLIQYAISPYIVSASMRLKYVDPGTFPWLENTVRELAAKSSVPMPRLAIVPNQTPNAFVFGNSTSRMTLAVHEGLLRQLNQDEVKGVIGHELGHIKHKDSIVMTFLSAIPLIAYIVSRAAFGFGYVGGRGERRNSASYLILAGAIALVVYFVAQLLVLRLSRLREHFSDAYSAYLTSSPRSLESALTKIAYGLSLRPEETPGTRALLISDPALARQEVGSIMDKREEYDLDKDGVLDQRELELAMEKEAKSTWASVNAAFSTHPPTYKRILLLHQIEEEMRTGNYTSTDIYKHV
jgi:heat shock protein HtpX